MHIDKNIKYLRKGRNWSQTELSEMLDVSHGAVGAYESGKNTPSFRVLIKLVEIFEVNLHDLVFRDLRKLGPSKVEENDTKYVISNSKEDRIEKLEKDVRELKMLLSITNEYMNDPDVGPVIKKIFERMGKKL